MSRPWMLSLLLSLGLSGVAAAAEIGAKLPNTTIQDANKQPATIPDFGKKVIAIFYADPDVSDQNDPFADLLKAADLDKATYRGVGIANLKDTWLPNSVILSIVRRKIEKYDATILTDPDHLLSTAWGLGDCNQQSVVVIIDKQGRAQYVKKGAMSPAEMQQGFELVKRLMAE